MLHPPEIGRGASPIVHTCHKVLQELWNVGWIELLALCMCIMIYKVIGSVCSQQDVVDIYWNLNIMYEPPTYH